MKITEISINKPIFTTMMITTIVVLGAFAYMRLGIDLMPNVEFPYAGARWKMLSRANIHPVSAVAVCPLYPMDPDMALPIMHLANHVSYIFFASVLRTFRKTFERSVTSAQTLIPRPSIRLRNDGFLSTS